MAASTPILIASDHAGFELKRSLVKLLGEFKFEDLGPSDSSRCDYPDFASKIARRVASQPGTLGILICGSGIGMSIAANKTRGARAAAVSNPYAARLAREHNDANILCLGARFTAPEYAAETTRAWLGATFAGGRHADRVRKISALESG